MEDEQLPGVELAAAIELVRQQLADAMEAGKNSEIAFRSGPVELEFELAFTKTGSGEAGIKVWVASFGAKGEFAHQSTNRLKVTLTPVDRMGKGALIGSDADQ